MNYIKSEFFYRGSLSDVDKRKGKILEVPKGCEERANRIVHKNENVKEEVSLCSLNGIKKSQSFYYDSIHGRRNNEISFKKLASKFFSVPFF